MNKTVQQKVTYFLTKEEVHNAICQYVNDKSLDGIPCVVDEKKAEIHYFEESKYKCAVVSHYPYED